MKHKIIETIEYIIARSVFFLVYLLPRKKAITFGKFLGRIIYKFKKQRQNALRNIKIAFGKKMNDEQIRQLLKSSFEQWGITIVEFMLLPKVYKKNLINELVEHQEVTNLLKQLLKREKGCIIVSGHFGMWEYAGASISNAGIPLNGIVRPMENTKIDRYINKTREMFGSKVIPKKDQRKMDEALKNNEVLIFIIDQNSTSKHSVFVPFFDKLASTPTGSAWFLSKYPDTPVVAFHSYRDENYIHRCEAERINIIKSNTYKEFIEKNIANFTTFIEKYVREKPEQWLWINNRWKTKMMK